MLAWALDARWDIPMGSDEHVAALVDVEQHPDYLRSGAAGLAEGSLYDAWQTGDASIAVSPLPPVAAGSEVDVTVTWPSAGSGRGARLELQADTRPQTASRIWSSGRLRLTRRRSRMASPSECRSRPMPHRPSRPTESA